MEATTLDPALLDPSTPTRELLRLLRVPPLLSDLGGLPESLLWQVFLELKRRGEAAASASFIAGLKLLHRRRSLGTGELSTLDTCPDEHRLTPNPYLAELWRSYKRCLCANRTGPAAQILREVELQLAAC